ncbi:MAG: TRAP transporter small permease [Brevinema sp.]
MIEKIKRGLDMILLRFLSILVFLIFISIIWQIFSRYILRVPATFTEEIVRFLLVWLGLLGAAYGFGSGKHLSLTLFFNSLKGKAQKNLSIVLTLITLAIVFSVFIYGGISLMILAKNQLSSVLAIPMIYVYTILPLSGSIISIYQICILIELLYKKELL